MNPPSPLDAPVRLVDWDQGTVVGRYRVAATETVLTGHYPGFPIFPGVCLVECAHATALAAARAGGSRVELRAVRSARFLAPVFPGDELTIRLRPATAEPHWRCTAVIEREDRPVARIQLDYRREEEQG